MVHEKSNHTLKCSSALDIQCTEIILSRSERPGFWLSNTNVFVKFEERLSKYESNQNSRSKLSIFTSGHY